MWFGLKFVSQLKQLKVSVKHLFSLNFSNFNGVLMGNFLFQTGTFSMTGIDFTTLFGDKISFDFKKVLQMA